MKGVKFGVSGHFLKNAWKKWPEILHAGVFWPPTDTIRLWSWSVDFSNFGVILSESNGSNLGFSGISWRTHWGNGLKFCMLMYPDHLQNLLDYGLWIFLILVIFILLCEMGQIWGFRAFWSCSVDFPHYGAPLTQTDHIWGFFGAEAYFQCYAWSSL